MTNFLMTIAFILICFSLVSLSVWGERTMRINFWWYKELSCYALVFSLTTGNFTLQFGPAYLYIGWSEFDRKFKI